jgi:hypothetical protein
MFQTSPVSFVISKPTISFVATFRQMDVDARTPPLPSMGAHSIVFASPVQGFVCKLIVIGLFRRVGTGSEVSGKTVIDEYLGHERPIRRVFGVESGSALNGARRRQRT